MYSSGEAAQTERVMRPRAVDGRERLMKRCSGLWGPLALKLLVWATTEAQTGQNTDER